MSVGEKTARLVMIPVPAMGHLVSMVELAKRLLRIPSPCCRFSITILIIQPLSPDPQLSSYVSTVSSTSRDICFLDLPEVEPPVVGGVPEMDALISAFHELTKPLVKSAIQALLSASPSVPITAVVLDMFCANMIGVASELGISPYIFYTSGAGFLSLALYSPTLDAAFPAGEKDVCKLQEEGYTIDLPGFSFPLHPGNLPSPFFYRKKFGYSYFVRLGLQFREAKGFLINTFAELEPHAVKALEHGLCIPGHPTPPIYPVGPLLSLNPNSPESEEHECIRWLNNQPPASVVFLCFGSKATLLHAQIKETAIALERSEHRFLWVLRCSPLPPEKQHQDPLALQPLDGHHEEVLPDGFLERTRGRGLVWPKFAPQKEILGHEAVGGFVTHCGWNSCLESLWFGVPMLGWPLHAEQHLNAAQMEKEMGVAIALEIDRKVGNWTTAEEVERGLRCLMENVKNGKGKEVRSRALEMKQKGRLAVADGGSSFLGLSRWMVEATKALR